MKENFNKKLFEFMSEKDFVTTKEIYELFPEMNSQTVSWHLHKLLKSGDIAQLAHGCYSLKQKSISQRSELLSNQAKSAFNILKTAGFDFYISGLDALKANGLNVTGNYPVLICTTKERMKDVQLELMRESDFAITENDISFSNNDKLSDRIQYYILGSKAFELSSDNVALKEKAFVDLYYAITRLGYPVAVTNLPRILSVIKPNEYKFKASTRDKGVGDELNFLLSYDRQFVKAFADLL